MTLNKLSIASKLWLAIVFLLGAMLAIGSLTLYRSHVIEARAVDSLTRTQALVRKAEHWKATTETSVKLGMASAVALDGSVNKAFKENLDNDRFRIAKLREELTKEADTPEDKALMKEVAAKGALLLATALETAKIAEAGNLDAVLTAIKSAYEPATAAYLGSIDQFAKAQQRKNEAAQAAAVDARRGVMWLAGAGALVVVALGMLVARLLVRTIRAPLDEAVVFAAAIAEGDLTRRIATSDRSDEFGRLMRSLDHMKESLAGLVGRVRSSTDSIGTASSEIAAGSQDLSSRTEQTAANLQQAAASMDQLTGTVRDSADSARQANQLASSAAEVAARGGEVVSQVVTTMDDINTSSRKIADIIGVIDGIAFQTNILALNAAVEAARAGEQGRGFAVVASEVRSLAQRSAQAAKEIKGLIGASVDKVEGGAKLVADAGQTMTEIVSSVQRVADIIGEITAAAGEQSDGIGQVNTAVVQLDQMTQQNAALVEESAAAAESLKDQAARLAEVVGRFRVA